MSCRVALAGLGVLVLLAVSCADPPSQRWVKYDPIPGVKAGDTPEEVKAVLKDDPVARENGYWMDSNRFSMDHQVWHYRDVGRVIFNRFDMTVYASESDRK